jgi:hypothetical protein
MREKTTSWKCLIAIDGSRRGGIDRGQWFELAIHGSGGNRYLASIRFYEHPSKEPFQAVKECDNPLALAAFLIAFDPLPVLRLCGLDRVEMRRVYEFQLQALLVAFEKKCQSITGSSCSGFA